MKISDLRAVRYAEDVLSGKQIASNKVILACKRFISDLTQQNNPKYKWRLDVDSATRIIDFKEKFLTPTKGNYSKMTLMNWQCFVNSNIYGWVDKKTGFRRFKESIMIVGRGNGKTTELAGDASYLASADGERGANVYLLANAEKQSRILFTECGRQIKGSPKLKKHFKITKQIIEFEATNSEIEHRASDSEKLDGLNPHGAIFDEIHEFKDWDLINVVELPMQKRDQPVLRYITTMGNVLDGPLMDLYQLSEKMLNGELPLEVADRFFAYIAEIDEHDDPNDDSCWIKANPSLGVLLSLENLKQSWERKKLIPQQRSDFINKQLNVFVNSGNKPFVSFEVMKRNETVIYTKELKGADCYGGFDLSAREDFTTACLIFDFGNGKYFNMQHSWIPRRKVELDNEKIPYKEYEENGSLTIVDGEYIDQSLIYDWFLIKKEIYNIRSIGYDPYNGNFLVEKLVNAGFECNHVRNGPITFSDPMKEMMEVLINGGLISNKDSLFMWYLSNVQLRTSKADDEKNNWYPVKRNRYSKIDGFMALMYGYIEFRRKNPVGLDNRMPSIETFKL